MYTSNDNFRLKVQKIPVTFVLITNNRFELIFKFNQKIIDVIKPINSSIYDFNTHRWNILLSHYRDTVKELNKLGIVEIHGLPEAIIKIFNKRINGLPLPPNPIDLISNSDFMKVDRQIREVLFPFQVKGVKFMIGQNGRCLLADDMGLGKTIQSLGAASFYKDEWPMLVIAPSSVKIAWRDQIKKWISEPVEVHVISTSRDVEQDQFRSLNRNSVVLVSYDLVSKLSKSLLQMNFKDESHFIKSSKTARAQGCIPLAKNAKRVFLLSGTPALSRPSEMFTQIDIIAPHLYKGFFKEFGTRYCDPKKTNWGVNYEGSSNTEELNIFLKEAIMLRRIKDDVLTELPGKRREVIMLAPEFLKRTSLKAHANIMDNANLKSLQRRGALLEYFQATGKAKIDAINNYIEDLLESPRKFLFFAHHTEVLNAVEKLVIKHKVGYIRIDGSISAEQKQLRADKFQNDDSVQIAILSIVAAGTGINLTAATIAVFGELFWNPGILLQAENRCHRIGQKDFVNIHYLVAEKTADDYIWPLVQNKMELLSKVGINKENFKDSEMTRLESSFSEKNTLLNYFQTDFIEEVKPEIIEEISKINEESHTWDDDFDDFDFDSDELKEMDSTSLPPKTADPHLPVVDCGFTEADFDLFVNDTDDGWEYPM